MKKKPISDEELAFELFKARWGRRLGKNDLFYEGVQLKWLAVARRAKRLLGKGSK